MKYEPEKSTMALAYIIISRFKARDSLKWKIEERRQDVDEQTRGRILEEGTGAEVEHQKRAEAVEDQPPADSATKVDEEDDEK